MSGENNQMRQLAAAWEAATAVVSEWAEQTAAVTSEAFHKLASDPAIRAVLESWRTTFVWGQRDCECVCARSHPDDMGICDKRAVITRHVRTGLGGDVDVPLCAPCAVAQGVAEMPRLPCSRATAETGHARARFRGRQGRMSPALVIRVLRWPPDDVGPWHSGPSPAAPWICPTAEKIPYFRDLFRKSEQFGKQVARVPRQQIGWYQRAGGGHRRSLG